jgi:hypothetical protein
MSAWSLLPLLAPSAQILMLCVAPWHEVLRAPVQANALHSNGSID